MLDTSTTKLIHNLTFFKIIKYKKNDMIISATKHCKYLFFC